MSDYESLQDLRDMGHAKNSGSEVMAVTVANPMGNGVSTINRGGAALVSVEQQRAIAETQARMIMARSNPRDPVGAVDRILKECMRPTLAEQALYQYSRGGSSISGPSIRLAEAMARSWGNIATGIVEVDRSNGYSQCKAFAWDLETNYYDYREFQVRHWRDTKKTPQNPAGGYPLTDERDIYELIANLGQRRKRAVILTVIPGDVRDAAVAQCEQTLKATADTSPEALKKVVDAFAAYGVTRSQLERWCQSRLEAIKPAQVVSLRKIFVSIKDEMSTPEDWFGTPLQTDTQKPGESGEPVTKQAPPPVERVPFVRRAKAEKPEVSQFDKDRSEVESSINKAEEGWRDLQPGEAASPGPTMRMDLSDGKIQVPDKAHPGDDHAREQQRLRSKTDHVEETDLIGGEKPWYADLDLKGRVLTAAEKGARNGAVTLSQALAKDHAWWHGLGGVGQGTWDELSTILAEENNKIWPGPVDHHSDDE